VLTPQVEQQISTEVAIVLMERDQGESVYSTSASAHSGIKFQIDPLYSLPVSHTLRLLILRLGASLGGIF